MRAWSYSRWSCWNTCPLQYKFKIIEKRKEPPSRAMERGIDIHKKGEEYLLGNIKGVPREYSKLAYEMRQLLKIGATPEAQWAATENWKACEWFSNIAWMRAKADAHYIDDGTLSIIDFKTGKEYASHEEQGELYALTGFIHEPEAVLADVEFWYVDSGEVSSYEYSAKSVAALKKKWAAKSKSCTTSARFIAKPGNHCRWCSFSSHKDGPCTKG